MPTEAHRPKRGRNFYGPGPYVEREIDEALLGALRDGEYVMVLGPRGSGKTSLRVRVSEELVAEGVHVATVDLGAIGTESRTDTFCASLVIEAGRSLGLGDVTKQAWRRSKGPPQLRLRACLREVILERVEGRVVLFVDELELVRALGDSSARDDFFAALQAMADARGHDPVWQRLSVCLLGALSRDELISDPRRSSFDLPARELSPRDFSREQLDDFAEVLGPLRVDTGALLDAIYEWTSGHPAMVQWICGDLLLREIESGQEATAVEATVRETFLQRGPEVDPLLGDTARRLRRESQDPYRTRILAAYERVLRGEIIDLRGRQLGSEGALVVARMKIAGLVAPSAGAKLRVRNKVIERAFDRNWVRRALAGRAVSDALERWESGGRRSGQLLRGEALRQALTWIEGRPDVSPSERDFVLASERARSRRLRRALIASGALSLGLVGLLLGALWQVQVTLDTPAGVTADGDADASELAGQDEEGHTKPDAKGHKTTASPNFVASVSQAVDEVSTSDGLRQKVGALEAELAALEQRLAIERAQRAELLAPDPERRADGLELALESLGPWVEQLDQLDRAPAPVTRGLTANLASPGDVLSVSAHDGAVERITLSQDGGRVATTSGAELRVWERASTERVADLTCLAGPIDRVALSPSGRHVAALSRDGMLTVWALEGGTALGPAPIPTPLGAEPPLAPIVTFSVDEEGKLRLERADGSVDELDPSAGPTSVRVELGELPSALPRESVATIPAGGGFGRRLAVIDEDQIELWDLTDGQALASVTAPFLADGGRVAELLATPTGSHLVVRLEGAHQLELWNPSTGALRTLAEHQDPISLVAMSSEGELLATATDDRRVMIWSIDEGELLAELTHEQLPTSLAFAPDGAHLLVGDASGVLRLHPLDLAGGSKLPLRSAALTELGAAVTVHFDEDELELRWPRERRGARWPLSRPMAKVQASVDGSRLALLDGEGTVRLVTGSGGPASDPLLELSEHRVLDLLLSSDGSLLVLASEDRQVQLYDASTGAPIATLTGHQAPVERLALDGERSRLISADRSKVVRVWDPVTAALLGTFTTDRRASALALSGEFFVIVDERGGAELWSLAAGARITTLELGGEPIASLGISVDGRWLALGRANAVELWPLDGAEAIARFRATGPILGVHFVDEGDEIMALDGLGHLARWPTRPSAWLAEGCAALPPGSVLPDACVDSSE